MTRILVTGASGCVGQYISRWLLDHSDAELLLWLRDPAKLTAVPTDHPRIRLLVGDLRDTDRFAKELAVLLRGAGQDAVAQVEDVLAAAGFADAIINACFDRLR